MRNVYRQMSYMNHDIATVLTVIWKLNWFRELYAADRLSFVEHMYFSASDIELFLVDLRSALDYLARAVRDAFQARTGQKTADSFHDLRKKCITGHYDRLLPPALRRQVTGCAWFEGLREVRGSVVHQGAEAIVFPDKAEVLFQVHQGLARRVLVPRLMYNPNIVKFELYAAALMTEVLCLTDELAPKLRTPLRVRRSRVPEGRYTHGGLVVLQDWIDSLVAIL